MRACIRSRRWPCSIAATRWFSRPRRARSLRRATRRRRPAHHAPGRRLVHQPRRVNCACYQRSQAHPRKRGKKSSIMTATGARKLFGTDGIRAIAGQAPLDPTTIYGVGLALAHSLRKISCATQGSSRPRHARIRPLDRRHARRRPAQSRRQVESAGIVTTPAVAFLARTHGFQAGVVISASHNPWQDNGIKLFGADGFKLARRGRAGHGRGDSSSRRADRRSPIRTASHPSKTIPHSRPTTSSSSSTAFPASRSPI